MSHPHWKELFDLFSRATQDKEHPFRLGYLASHHVNGYPGLRTLVLRRVLEPFSLEFFTDRRSPKVSQLRADRRVTSLFYDPIAMLQVTAYGEADLPDDPDELTRLWEELPSWNRKDYQGDRPPGEEIDMNKNPVEPNRSGDTAENFQPVRIRVSVLEVLQLDRAGHRRYRLVREDDTAWRTLRIEP